MKRQLFFLLMFIASFTGWAQTPRMVLPVGHTDDITLLKFSPDGRILASGSKDKTIKLWDVQTGKLLADLKGHADDILSIEFNRQGTRLLSTADLDTTAILWNVQTGESLRSVSTGPYYIAYAVFSPDGNTFTVENNSSDLKPALYSSETGLPVVQLQANWKYSTKAAAYSPDGSLLLVVFNSDKPEIYTTKTGERVAELDVPNTVITAAQWFPDGQTVALASYDKQVYIWNVKNNQIKYTLSGHTSAATSLTVSPGGKQLLSASPFEQDARLWNVQTGELITTLKVSDYSSLQTAVFSADEKYLMTTAIGGTRVWDAATGMEIKTGLGRFNETAFTNNGKELFLKHDDKGKRFNLDTKHTVIEFEESDNLSIPVFSTSGKFLAGTYNSKRSLAIWNTETGKLVVQMKTITQTIDDAFLVNKPALLVTNPDKNPTFWKLQGNLISPFMHPVNEDVQFLRYSPNDSILVQIRKKNDNNNDVFANDEKVSIWQAPSLTVVDADVQKRGMQSLTQNAEGSFTFSSDSKQLFIGNNDWGSYVLDAATGKLKYSIEHERIWQSAVNTTMQRFVSFTENKITLKNIPENKIIRSWATTEHLNRFHFVGMSNRFITGGADNMHVYDEQKEKPILTIPAGLPFFNSNNSRVFVSHFSDSNGFSLWDLDKLKQLWKKAILFTEKYEARWDVCWSADESRLFISTNNGRVLVLDALTGEQMNEFSAFATRLVLSKDGRLLFAYYKDDVAIYDASDYRIVTKLVGHTNEVTATILLPDQTKVLTVSKDNTAKIWNITTGQLLYSYIMLDKNYSLRVLPSGFYMADKTASRLLHYVSKDLKIITFEQLDVKFNRPDKVLEAIGFRDTALIASYRQAYNKRIKKLGIDTTQFADGYSVPEADFGNRTQIGYELPNEQLTLRIKGADSMYTLDHFNIWINEVPLFGMKGISIRNRKSNTFDTTLTIRLSQGENRIETSVANVNGTESYRMPLYVKFTAAKPIKDTVHFIGIGINEFADNKRNLQWCVKDIRDLALKFKEKYGDAIVIDTLFNKNVTLKNVQALKQKLLKTNINDKVIIAYSGHGLLSKQYDYYLSSYNVNFRNPAEGGIVYEEIEKLLDSIPARKKLLLIDACHSGEVDKDEMLAIREAKNKTGNKGLIMNRGSEEEGEDATIPKTKTLGLQNSFELMQSLFINVGKGTGATIISAAGGVQFAQERNDLENGVFTFCLLEALEKQNNIKVSQLKQIVGERVEQLTNGLQKPTTRNELKDFDWIVW
ncbi:WD40 repeat protein [Lacibacter cauensis]|uniref:WD40 repeat protein n=1 Tax=Lacibacter cauensis TaxID=510947 RepID=A0A562SH12_9BACT|nr:caspase family protein [Lacibacter cauensis]TWI80559.1 WD40 repeat protein [Lacibacter cauensis]